MERCLAKRTRFLSILLMTINGFAAVPPIVQIARADPLPQPAIDSARRARGELEIARLRAMQRFDRSPTGKALIEQVQVWEQRLEAAMAGTGEHDQVAAAAGLHAARAALDSAREAAVAEDPAVKRAAAIQSPD
jgi:hypothetical protein